MSNGCITGKLDDQTIAAINRILAELDNQPALWHASLSNIIDTMNSDTHAEINHAVKALQDLLSSALAQVSYITTTAMGQGLDATFCVTDHLGKQIADNIRSILHSNFAYAFPNGPTPRPTVCLTYPADRVSPKDGIITYYGFDLGYAANGFAGSVVYGDGTIAVPKLGNVAITGESQIELEFQGLSDQLSGLDARRNPMIVLTFTGGMKQSALPLEIADKKPPRPNLSATEVASDGSYTLNWGGSGSTVDLYELQEDYQGTGWRDVYSGPLVTWTTTKPQSGSFQYIVRASEAGIQSDWSNTVPVDVKLPSDAGNGGNGRPPIGCLSTIGKSYLTDPFARKPCGVP